MRIFPPDIGEGRSHRPPRRLGNRLTRGRPLLEVTSRTSFLRSAEKYKGRAKRADPARTRSERMSLFMPLAGRSGPFRRPCPSPQTSALTRLRHAPCLSHLSERQRATTARTGTLRVVGA